MYIKMEVTIYALIRYICPKLYDWFKKTFRFAGTARNSDDVCVPTDLCDVKKKKVPQNFKDPGKKKKAMRKLFGSILGSI